MEMTEQMIERENEIIGLVYGIKDGTIPWKTVTLKCPKRFIFDNYPYEIKYVEKTDWGELFFEGEMYDDEITASELIKKISTVCDVDYRTICEMLSEFLEIVNENEAANSYL